MTRTVVLLRHGQSTGNAEGIFSGLLDVPLTAIGREEAASAADLLDDACLWPRTWFCSPLLRAHETATILAGKVRRSPAEVAYDWRLAERNYGALTGRTKSAVLAEYGEETFRTWRRSLDVAPPAMSLEQRDGLSPAPETLGLTESLSDVVVRVNDLWRDRIAPVLERDRSALIVAHGNSLRALCTLLDRLNEREVQDLNIPTGHPLVYRLGDDGRPLVRGGSYLDHAAANAAAATIASEGGT